jgi:hypothetical protein
VKGPEGSQQDYGMRIYDPRIGRFLSVDPLTKKFARYSPYQFAGNKPIVFIDIDGAEEYYDPANDPFFLINIWDNAVDGLGNLLLKLAIPQTEGLFIRKALKKQGFIVPNSGILDVQLARVFDIHKENRSWVVTPERTATEKLVELGVSILDIAAVIPAKGSPFIAAVRTSPITAATVTDILKGLTINARTKEIAESFVDLTRGKGIKLSQFEAESGAILETSHDIKLRQIKEGEAGDYAIESGTLNGLSVAGKTIDQMGVPLSAVGKFKMSDIKKQITNHFSKPGVDIVLFDGRNLTQAQKN